MMCECHLVFPENVDIKSFWCKYGFLIVNRYSGGRLLLYYKPRNYLGRRLYGRMIKGNRVLFIWEKQYHTVCKTINETINIRRHESGTNRTNV